MSKKLCYNRGCNLEYDPDNNPEGCCWYHPGVPVFHDAYKGWSCCNKKSTDFTDFLNFKGCQSSKHSSVKTEDPRKELDEGGQCEITSSQPKKVDPEETRGPMYVPKERPPVEAPVIDLPRTITDSLSVKLKDFESERSINGEGDMKVLDESMANIKIGTPCNNKGCKASYGPDTRTVCDFHPGYPVFHEGMKFWTCCQKKTSDFDAFLNQAGCETGRHLWIKPKESTSNVDKSKACRFDWHQTATHVYLTIYSKLPFPDESSVKMNQVKALISITFGVEKKQFEKELELYGVVDLHGSQVVFAPTKVELNLKKAEPIYWLDIEQRE